MARPLDQSIKHLWNHGHTSQFTRLKGSAAYVLVPDTVICFAGKRVTNTIFWQVNIILWLISVYVMILHIVGCSEVELADSKWLYSTTVIIHVMARNTQLS